MWTEVSLPLIFVLIANLSMDIINIINIKDGITLYIVKKNSGLKELNKILLDFLLIRMLCDVSI